MLYQVCFADFLDAGRKMAMPEEHHFLLQGPRAVGHPFEPPTAQLKHVLAIGALNFAKSSASFLFAQLPRLHEFLGAVGIGFGPFRIGRSIRDLVVLDEMSYSCFWSEGKQLFNLSRRAAKP